MPRRVGYDFISSAYLLKVSKAITVNALLLIGLVLLAPPLGAQTEEVAPPAKAASGLYQPQANPKAVVAAGHARFTVLTPQLIRMEWAADGKFEDRASLVFVNRDLPAPEFSTPEPAAGAYDIKTHALQLHYAPQAGSDGRFTVENLSVTLTVAGKQVTWHPGMADTGNLQGTTRTLDGALGGKTKEPMDPGLISRDGWAVVDDSTRPLFDSTDFRLVEGENSPWPWVVLRSSGERQDWYFFGYGHDYQQALADFTKIAGRIPLPPRFAFGAWWSRYWAYSDQELDALVRGYGENGLPLDVLVIDMEWHKTFGLSWFSDQKDQSGHTKGWSGYSWNRLLFPYPEEFLSNLHQDGLKVTLNLHPASGVQPWEDAYPEMAKAMGVDPASQKYVPFDITNKKFATNYLNILHHPVEKQGIDFWWLDWQQESNTQTPGLNPTWWLNYVHFSDQQREGKRPLLFHRWGGLGNHRYQIGFSGDTISKWDSLAFQPWFTATAANVGYAYWSHDIGGHMPGEVAPELYTRWLQFGIYSPILRTHTTKNPDAERRIWAYPEPYSGIMRDLYHQRYAMLPYIYTEARRTYDTGLAFLHPLYYDWPDASEAYANRNEYMFGHDLFVNPVVQPGDKVSGLVEVTSWVPPGDWIEAETGKHFKGPLAVKRNFSIRQIPVYVREGAIVPMSPPMRYSNQKPLDPLILKVYPPGDGQTSQYTLYEDAGDTVAYQEGQAAWTAITATSKGADLTLAITPVKGSYPGMVTSRGYTILLPGDWPPASVTVNGQPVNFTKDKDAAGWRFEGNTLTTVINVPASPVSSGVQIVVGRAAELRARQAELDDFAGVMTRLREAYDTLNQNWPLGWSPDELVDAMQTGDRLSYHPENAGEQLARLGNLLPKVIASVADLSNQSSEKQRQVVIRKLSKEYKSNEVKGVAARFQNNLARAKATLADTGGKP